MPALDIRRYEPADVDAVWDLHVRALDDAGAYDEEFEHLDADLRAVTEEYLDAGGAFLVGETRAEERLKVRRADPRKTRAATRTARSSRWARSGPATSPRDRW